MQKVWFFDFEARQWSCRIASGGSAEWTFGHAIKRGKYMYAYGTHHTNSTEESFAAVSSLHTCVITCYSDLCPKLSVSTLNAGSRYATGFAQTTR